MEIAIYFFGYGLTRVQQFVNFLKKWNECELCKLVISKMNLVNTNLIICYYKLIHIQISFHDTAQTIFFSFSFHLVVSIRFEEVGEVDTVHKFIGLFNSVFWKSRGYSNQNDAFIRRV